MKKVFIIAPLIVFLIALSGSIITSDNLDWYFNLNLPENAPDGSFIGSVWTIIYILSTISFIIFYIKNRSAKEFKLIFSLFVLNALLNFSWTLVFFALKIIELSIFVIFFLNLTNLALIALLWRINILSSILLVPYFVWVSFASYLNCLILALNV